MSYNIHNNQFIWVKFYEDHPTDAVKDFIHDIIEQYPADQRDRILVDTRNGEVSDNVLAMGGIMKDFDVFGVDKSIKIAVLRVPGKGKYHQYMQDIVTEEGYNFELFTDFEEATYWLNQEET